MRGLGKVTGGLVEPMRTCLKLALRPLDRGQKAHRHCILPEISFLYFLPWHMRRTQLCVNSSAKSSSGLCLWAPIPVYSLTIFN